MASDEKHRDFTLCELSHPGADLFRYLADPDRRDRVKEVIGKEIREKLEWGKKRIDEETEPGDLVMLERPEEYSLETFKRNYAGTEFEKFSEHWDFILKDYFNFFHALRQYAEAQGRRVVSLEHPRFRPDGETTRRFAQSPNLSAEERTKAQYDIVVTRNQIMEKLIHQHKPRLVIASSGHALHLEEMRPKKVTYHKPWPELHRKSHRLMLAGLEREHAALAQKPRSPSTRRTPK